MPDHRRRKCVVCGEPDKKVGALSWTGKCGTCARARLEANADQMHARSGPNFEHWRRRMAASVGGVLLDDARPRP